MFHITAGSNAQTLRKNAQVPPGSESVASAQGTARIPERPDVFQRWYATLKRQAAKAWLRTRMIRPIPETMTRVAAIIRGHCNYYGINGNLRSLYKFHDYMKQTTHKMLNRRSQKGYVTYEKFQRIWDYYVAPPKLTKDIWQGIPKTV